MIATLLTAVVIAGPLGGEGEKLPTFGGSAVEPVSVPETVKEGEGPEATYRIYVLAESADRIHRVRFGPDGGEVEETKPIGAFPVMMEGPHGIQVSPDGESFYVTTGHGIPEGQFWEFQVGREEPVSGPIDLGRFPATVDVTPDGLYAFVSNLNLYGEMVPSTISTIHLPSFQEVEQTTTCTMPHGSRVSPDGLHHYSVCMMDDQLVELSTQDFQVSRRFSLVQGEEGPMEVEVAEAEDHHHDHPEHHADDDETPEAGDHVEHDPTEHEDHDATCTPTWADTDPEGDFIYVACVATDEVIEIRRDEWEKERRFATDRGPYNLEVTADLSTLVVTLREGAGVEFIDLERGESVAVHESSTERTHGVVTSPDSKYAFVSVEGVGDEPGRVDIYELDTFDRVETVEVRQQAAGIAFLEMEPEP